MQNCKHFCAQLCRSAVLARETHFFLQLSFSSEQFPDVPANVIAEKVFAVTKSVFRRNILEKAQR